MKYVINKKMIVPKINKNGERRYNAEITLGIGTKKKIITGWFVEDKNGVLHFATAFSSKKNKNKGE